MRCAIGSIFRYLWLVLVGVALLALINYPRTWWHELISATSPLWAFVLLGCVIVLIIRLFRSGLSIIEWLALSVQVVCIIQVAQMVSPYVYSSKMRPPTGSCLDSSEGSARVINLAVADRLTDELLSEIAPQFFDDIDVLILIRSAQNLSFKRLPQFLAKLSSDKEESGTRVEIYSRINILPGAIEDLGIGAGAGIVAQLQARAGPSIDLAAFDLLPNLTQSDFSISNLTSRRAASAIRYSVGPRMVVGAFRTSSTSPLVNMFVDQLKFKSVFFNSGWSGFARVMLSAAQGADDVDVFISKEIVFCGQREWQRINNGAEIGRFSVSLGRP